MLCLPSFHISRIRHLCKKHDTFLFSCGVRTQRNTYRYYLYVVYRLYIGCKIGKAFPSGSWDLVRRPSCCWGKRDFQIPSDFNREIGIMGASSQTHFLQFGLLNLLGNLLPYCWQRCARILRGLAFKMRIKIRNPYIFTSVGAVAYLHFN